MNAEREELELVTEFGSLKAGDLTLLKGCRWCGESHRGILVKFFPAEPRLAPDGSIEVECGWLRLPTGCKRPNDHLAGVTNIGPIAVSERRLYRVVIPPAAASSSEHSEQPATTARKRERQGVR